MPSLLDQTGKKSRCRKWAAYICTRSTGAVEPWLSGNPERRRTGDKTSADATMTSMAKIASSAHRRRPGERLAGTSAESPEGPDETANSAKSPFTSKCYPRQLTGDLGCRPIIAVPPGSEEDPPQGGQVHHHGLGSGADHVDHDARVGGDV